MRRKSCLQTTCGPTSFGLAWDCRGRRLEAFRLYSAIIPHPDDCNISLTDLLPFNLAPFQRVFYKVATISLHEIMLLLCLKSLIRSHVLRIKLEILTSLKDSTLAAACLSSLTLPAPLPHCSLTSVPFIPFDLSNCFLLQGLYMCVFCSVHNSLNFTCLIST